MSENVIVEFSKCRFGCLHLVKIRKPTEEEKKKMLPGTFRQLIDPEKWPWVDFLKMETIEEN